MRWLQFSFQNLPFSKSAGKKCAVFVQTGGLSVTFFTVFKMCRHRVNAVLVYDDFTSIVKLSYSVLSNIHVTLIIHVLVARRIVTHLLSCSIVTKRKNRVEER